VADHRLATRRTTGLAGLSVAILLTLNSLTRPEIKRRSTPDQKTDIAAPQRERGLWGKRRRARLV
jgi:hypothetical protein